MNKWTEVDELNALRYGYGVFQVDTGRISILKMDDPINHPLWKSGMPTTCQFKSDLAAVRFVHRRARRGDRTAQKALLIAS